MSQLAHALESKIRSKDVLVEDSSVSFESFLLPPKILQGLSSCGFRRPSPIQVKAIPVGRCGLDVIVKSKSGTGKTLVFGIVALEGLHLQKKGPQVLILAPTREIAVQIEDVLRSIGQFYESLFIETFIGGLPVEGDLPKCKKCHIAIGSPGRIKQLITMGCLDTKQVRLFILDEADKLMENSFQNDINEIYNSLPDKKQVIMCSATYPNEMESFLGEYMLSPTFVSAESDTPLLLGLKQFVRVVKSSPNVVQQTKVKNDELVKILSSIHFTQCLVFSNFQTRAQSVSNFLNRTNFQSTFISAAQNQVDRLSAIQDLKHFKCKILLSTDLTARGIDAANVDLVINYDIPADTMTYLHRMGRAGRYGSTGICVNLAAQGQEVALLQNILGTIGGLNLFIPKLDDSFSIEKVDLSAENSLCGLLHTKSDESNDNLRTVVIESKKRKKKNTLKNETCVNEADEIQNIVEHKIGESDPLSILSDLASENFQFQSDNLKSCTSGINMFDSNSIFNELMSENVSHSGENYVEKPLEICSKTDSVQDILEQLATEGIASSFEVFTGKECKTENILNKNKALFSMAKSLSNCPTSKDDSIYLTQYLDDIKMKDKYCQILYKDSAKKEVHVGVGDNNHEMLENIFSIAYNCAINENGISWKEMAIPDREILKLKEGHDESSYFEESQEDEDLEHLQQDCDDYSEDNYDPDYDFDIEKDININIVNTNNDYNMQNSEEYTFMKWVPVESNKKIQNVEKSVQKSTTKYKNNYSLRNQENVLSVPSTSTASKVTESYCEEYKKYLDQCNESLWQHGLSFESVDQFDEWFWYDWQSQVSAVRDFIRQKIYVEEMTRYQEIKNDYIKD